MSTTYIPVKAEEWSKMVEATKLAADLMVENKRLKDENERLRKAGDAMTYKDLNKQVTKWVSEDAHNKLKAENERLRKATEWQPIETAPKDDETELLVLEYGFVYVGKFDKDGYCADIQGAGLDPSHWMPLPAAPAAKEGRDAK